jgi:hypothetical protein
MHTALKVCLGGAWDLCLNGFAPRVKHTKHETMPYLAACWHAALRMHSAVPCFTWYARLCSALIAVWYQSFLEHVMYQVMRGACCGVKAAAIQQTSKQSHLTPACTVAHSCYAVSTHCAVPLVVQLNM